MIISSSNPLLYSHPVLAFHHPLPEGRPESVQCKADEAGATGGRFQGPREGPSSQLLLGT